MKTKQFKLTMAAMLTVALAALAGQKGPSSLTLTPFSQTHAFNGAPITLVDSVASDTTKTDTVKAPEKKPTEWEELMKKAKLPAQEGLFKVNKIEGRYYFTMPDSLLGRYVLAVTRFTAVPQNFGKFAGEEINESMIYFEHRDSVTMLMRAYARTQIADSTHNISRTLSISTTDPIVATLKILKGSPEGSYTMDVTDLFKNDNDLVGIPTSARNQFKIGAIDAGRTFVDTMKVFPINIEVGTTRTYAAGTNGTIAAGSGSITIGLNTSMVLLPKEPMRQRIWDKRVGYFVNNVTYFTDDQHKAERESFIARYRLVPKDVKAYKRGELVEPVKPIIYYIDPATPKKWVPYLIAGINDWNVAFEAAGFKNAIQGKEWPNDPNMSLDDARYCVIRYLPAEIENAYGPHVSDPRSGEIIESHICWYHNIMNLLTKWYMIQCSPSDKRARTMNFDDELMGELIRFVSSHEVGHSLGLRHNMGASSRTPVELLRDKKWVEEHGHTASIMDYARFNYVAQPEDNISPKGLFPRINDYDKWAIKWGYQYRPEYKDEREEKEALMKETTKILAKNPRLWFAGEGWDEDPRSQTEDLSDDNMKASEYGLKNLQYIMKNVEKWTAQSDDRYEHLSEIYGAVRNQYSLYLRHVLKNVANRYLNNMPGTMPIEVAPKEKHKAAVDYIARNVFTTPMWLFPQEIVTKTQLDMNNEVLFFQDVALDGLLKQDKMKRIADDAYLSPDNYTLDEYLDDVFNAVWTPLSADNTIQDRYRRSLHRGYLIYIAALLQPNNAYGSYNDRQRNNDVVPALILHLNKLEKHINTQLEGLSAESINAVHYRDILSQIEIIRERRAKK